MPKNFYINGEIGWEVKLQSIQKDWNDDVTDVHINSLGGDVWEGIAIYNFLKGKGINTHTNGVVASIASVIFLSGKERTVNQWDDFLIHLPFTFGAGTSDDLQKSADELRKVEDKLAKIYESETSLTYDEAIEQMKTEEFVTPDWLIEKGFANTIREFKAVASINNKNKNTKMTNLTDNDKSWIEQKFQAIANLFKPKNKIVQNANGEDVDFYELGENDVPKVGDKANFMGNPADGEILMPSGETYVFVAGELTEIKPDESEPDATQALKEENEALKLEIETLKASAKKEATSFNNLKVEFENFKNEFSTKFNYDPKRQPEPEPTVQRLNLRK